MNRFMFLTLLLLIGCQVAPIGKTINTKSPSPQTTLEQPMSFYRDDFQFNQQCPHLCWLSINPGTTTSQDAIRILSVSNHIDQESLQVSSSQTYEAVWYTGRTKASKTAVYMDLKNGLIRMISFDHPPFSLSDFMNLVGEPDKIRFMVMRTAETTEVIYAVYFSSTRVMIESGG